MNKIMSSFDTVVEYLNESKALSNKIALCLDSQGKIELPMEIETIKRSKIFYFYHQAIDLLNNRSDFIVECLNTQYLNSDILDNLLRGLIELYCILLFFSKQSNSDILKRIIWSEMYIFGLLEIKQNRSLNDQQYSRIIHMHLSFFYPFKDFI